MFCSIAKGKSSCKIRIHWSKQDKWRGYWEEIKDGASSAALVKGSPQGLLYPGVSPPSTHCYPGSSSLLFFTPSLTLFFILLYSSPAFARTRGKIPLPSECPGNWASRDFLNGYSGPIGTKFIVANALKRKSNKKNPHYLYTLYNAKYMFFSNMQFHLIKTTWQHFQDNCKIVFHSLSARETLAQTVWER